MRIPKDLYLTLKRNGINVSDVVLYANSKCNLRCLHCYLGNELLETAREFEAGDVVDFLSEVGPLKRLTILGGEPFLHSEINEILRSPELANVTEKRITTNLTSLKRVDLTAILSSGFRVCVSVDGSDENLHEYVRGRNTFKHVIANIQKLVSMGIDIEIVHTVNRLNLSRWEEFLRLTHSLGVRRLNLHSLSKVGNAQHHPELWVTPTEWREFTNSLEKSAVEPDLARLRVRFERRFLSGSEFRERLASGSHKTHSQGSYYAQQGHRIVIHPDQRVYISSEAFGTEHFIADISGVSTKFNENEQNEFLDGLQNTSNVDIYDRTLGDENYPHVISVSDRTTVHLS